ncbi:hypothetical protein E2C01_031550 [Portunus trituberculatus]|uniref:Uncharacterized protein n=1 Tax=Portunus trituberculatus TaxID=210409 RepID=A0A5B7EYE8_PORTR|nr:hypothetical protein [Portunus trituberculatus]
MAEMRNDMQAVPKLYSDASPLTSTSGEIICAFHVRILSIIARLSNQVNGESAQVTAKQRSVTQSIPNQLYPNLRKANLSDLPCPVLPAVPVSVLPGRDETDLRKPTIRLKFLSVVSSPHKTVSATPTSYTLTLSCSRTFILTITTITSVFPLCQPSH